MQIITGETLKDLKQLNGEVSDTQEVLSSKPDLVLSTVTCSFSWRLAFYASECQDSTLK